MRIENEFIDAMNTLYKGVSKDSPQYKTSRLMFYTGAFVMLSSKGMGSTENELSKSVYELREALKFTSKMTTTGLSCEDILADYVEGKGERG